MTLFDLIKKGIITLKQAADSLNMSEDAFKSQLAKYGFELYNVFVILITSSKVIIT